MSWSQSASFKWFKDNLLASNSECSSVTKIRLSRTVVNLHVAQLQMTDSYSWKLCWKRIRINWMNDEENAQCCGRKVMGVWVQLVLFTDQKHIFLSYIYSVMFQGLHTVSSDLPTLKIEIWKTERLESLIYFILPNVIFSGLRMTDSDTLKHLV